MRKLYFALIATLGVAGLAASVPAEAGVVVGVGLPGVAVVPPRVVIGPGLGFYGRPYYGGPGFYRSRWNGGGFGPCYTQTPIGPVWNCGK